MQIRPLLTALALALASCERASPDASIEIADSAGVRVVVSDPTRAPVPVFRISAEPIAAIGTADGPPESQLFQASSGTVLDDGTIVVANNGSREVRFYDREGTYLRSVGQEGGGPGEFLRARLVGAFAKDSLLVWDGQQRRFSVFDREGSFVRSFQSPADGTILAPSGVLDDGRPVLVERTLKLDDPDARSGIERTPESVLVVERDGSALRSLGDFPGNESSVHYGGQGPSGMGVVFGRRLHTATHGDRIAVGNDDSYGVRVYGADGRLLLVIRQPREPVTVQPGDFERALPEPLRPDAPSSMMKSRMEPNIAQMPRHETFPAYESLRFDRAGNLFVQEYQPPWEESTSWQAFDREGALVGRLDLPPRFDVLDIGEDWILGRTRDELDIEHVVLHRLERTEGASREDDSR